MKIFVTGASGWIGSGVVRELLGNGHEVIGLARSDASADRIKQAGAEVLRGDLEDLGSLKEGAAAADGVVHMGYNHDFSRMEAAAATDLAAINAMAEVTDKGAPFLIASGVAGMTPGRVATERDMPDAAAHPRVANAQLTLDMEKGVVRFAPTVHGNGDHGFVAELVRIARVSGVSGYTPEGRWPAVHRDDAAVLVRLAVERAEPGAVVHAIAEEGVPTIEIAEAIGRGLNLPVEERPAEHFGWLGRFFSMNSRASSAITREKYGWNPVQAGLIADLDEGHYFAV